MGLAAAVVHLGRCGGGGLFLPRPDTLAGRGAGALLSKQLQTRHQVRTAQRWAGDPPHRGAVKTH